jgi:hypothetical protein
MLRPMHSSILVGKAKLHSFHSFPGILVPGHSNPSPEEAAPDEPSNPGYQGGIVTKIAKLASVLTLVMLFLAGMAFAQTDPGVQSASRGTGAALSSVLSNSPSGILGFFH